MPHLPKLSVVTTSFNQGPFLEETILSVLNQGYANLEYIIIDGGSADHSVEIIRRYERHLAYWVSEKDRNQVHALNKGFARATGDLFAFINSDDVYLPGAFAAVTAVFQQRPQTTWLCGDTIMFGHGHATELIRSVVPKSAAHALAWAYKAPQPGMFWRREILHEFDEKWQYNFDQDAYVRLLLAGHVCEHLPLPLAAYRLHGSSKTVAENHHQIRESELLAEHYQDQLAGRGRRWCQATQLFRSSYAASEKGEWQAGANYLARGLLLHPESIAGRPFWGCLRRVMSSATARD